MRARLNAQAVDLEGLAALIPPGSVRFSGFTVVKAVDVTDQEVLSSIKRDLIDKESIVSNARFEKLQAKLRTLFRRADLRLSLAAVEGDRDPGAQLRPPAPAGPRLHLRELGARQDHRLRGLGLREGDPAGPAGLRGGPRRAAPRSAKEEMILSKGIRSLVVAPLHYQGELIGMLSLGSPHPGDLNTLLAAAAPARCCRSSRWR